MSTKKEKSDNVISFLDFKHRKEHQRLNEINEYLSKAEILDKLLSMMRQ